MDFLTFHTIIVKLIQILFFEINFRFTKRFVLYLFRLFFYLKKIKNEIILYLINFLFFTPYIQT